jgi:cyclophilin family peptidyl-prolyl cis-trans isomerase
VFHTTAGDLVFALYPDTAPKTVMQFLALVRAGVYDTTNFARIVPGFVAQVSSAADRTRALTAEQASLVHRLPAELSILKHERGILSMARQDGDLDGAETSFSVLLGSAPHLDGNYTIFGRLVAGDEVLDEMVRVPRVADRPVARIEVQKAVVVPSEKALAHIELRPARAIPFVEHPTSDEPAAGVTVPAPSLRLQVGGRPSIQLLTAAMSASTPPTPREGGLTVPAGGLAILLALSLLSFLLQGRVLASVHSALNTAMLFVATSTLAVLSMPSARMAALAAPILCLGLWILLRMLGRRDKRLGRDALARALY